MPSVRRLALSSIVLVIVASLLLLQPTNGANILGVFTSSSISHVIVHMSLMKALAEKGHNVTVVTTIKPTVTHKAINHIYIPISAEYQKQFDDMVKQMITEKNNIITTLGMILSQNALITAQVDTLKRPEFVRLYKAPDTKYDVLFLGYFMNEFQLGLGAKFNCPIIISWMSATVEMTDRLIGNPREVAYVPSFNNQPKDGKVMDFFERVINMLVSWMLRGFTFLMDFHMKSYYRELFANDPAVPPYEQMKKNISLIFTNSHLSEGPTRPNVPAIVEIGGIQVKDKPDPLPKDIAEFLDSAKQTGAILFSLGSNLKGSSMKSDIVKMIFNVLSSLNQKVIWKWEDLENTPGKSANILYKKWLPQDDILAHPNIRLFITHAGKGGIAEAQYHGVPMVALPVFADQHSNAAKMALSGYGLQLEMLSLVEDEFRNAILEVLSNPSFSEKVKTFSKLYRDRPMSAKENVVYWTEYVIRYHGAKHIQSPLVHLNYFQSESYDVIAFLLVIFYVVCKIFKFVIKFVWGKIFARKSSKIEAKLKKH